MKTTSVKGSANWTCVELKSDKIVICLDFAFKLCKWPGATKRAVYRSPEWNTLPLTVVFHHPCDLSCDTSHTQLITQIQALTHMVGCPHTHTLAVSVCCVYVDNRAGKPIVANNPL